MRDGRLIAFIASTDRAPTIDWIDADLLIDSLEHPEFGVKKEQAVIEQLTIDKKWVATI